METQRRAGSGHSVPGAIRVFAVAGMVLVGTSPAAADHKKDGCREAASVPNPFVKLRAHEKAFDTDCLVVPSDRRFRIYLKNEDRDVAHNVSIYPERTSTKETKAPEQKSAKDSGEGSGASPVFKGKSFKGPEQEEYSVDALSEGRYWFQCEAYPGQMGGTLKVEKKKYDTY